MMTAVPSGIAVNGTATVTRLLPVAVSVSVIETGLWVAEMVMVVGTNSFRSTVAMPAVLAPRPKK